MSNGVFHFKLGGFDCTVIRDTDDGEQNVLIVNTGQHKVIFDPGCGAVTSPPGLLMARMHAAGVSPAEIDTVILSHADFDHVGGTVKADGTPAFPQARYVLSRAEQDYWATHPVRLQASPEYDQRFLDLENKVPPACLEKLNGRLHAVEFDTEIVPGIRSVVASGHTPGHMALAIGSNGQQVLYVGDLLYEAKNLEDPQWFSVFDGVPADAIAGRKRIFTQAANDQQLLLAYHMPFPGLGYVTKNPQTNGWEWESYTAS